MKTLEERLRKALMDAGRKQTELAKACGVTKGAVSQWLSGTVKTLEGVNLISAADFLKVNPTWLANGTGSSKRGDAVTNVAIAPAAERTIPVISYVQAGNWRDIVDNNPIGYSDDTIPARGEYGVYTFALRILGNSMEPEFREGDVVVIDPDVAPNPGDFVVARNHAEEATFKKYRPRGINEAGDTIFELVPLNEDYAVMRSDQQTIQIIGTMVEHTRYRRRS